MRPDSTPPCPFPRVQRSGYNLSVPMLAQVFLHQIDALPMAIGAAALTVVAVFWLYPAQVRAAAGTFGWMLPVLRSLALLALAAVLLKPVLLRPRSEHERGAVLVLLD